MSLPLLGLSLLAAALLLPEVARLASMQLAGLGGEHATENHWILTANLECMFIIGGLLAATRRPGWKALGIIVGLAFVYLGVASISLPYYAGSWNVWAARWRRSAAGRSSAQPSGRSGDRIACFDNRTINH